MTLDINAIISRLPKSAMSVDDNAKRKSPTKTAVDSPQRTCNVLAPRRDSAPSKMSSWTNEAPWRTSMAVANFTADNMASFCASSAFATSSTNAGRNLFPPLCNIMAASSRTTSLAAPSESEPASKSLSTAWRSAEMHAKAMANPALGSPSSFHSGRRDGVGACKPIKINSRRSSSATLVRSRPRPWRRKGSVSTGGPCG
mmetsp:Transcript_14127/g.38742  ORF Transcript_14127/g.38742 Transcript_14127/m.38742 type:complete len:200 (-) Transcript_14127:1244-1843(-)